MGEGVTTPKTPRCPELGLAASTAYKERRCRCEVCRGWMSAKNAAYRAGYRAEPMRVATTHPSIPPVDVTTLEGQEALWAAFMEAFLLDLNYAADIMEASVPIADGRVLVDSPLRDLASAMREVPAETRKHIASETKKNAQPIWEQELRERAASRIQQRALVNSGRVGVTARNVFLRSVVFGVLTLAGIAGTVILQIHRPDATASFTTFVFQMLGLVAVAGGLGAGLNSVQQKVEAVQRQTNGTLSKKDEEITRLNAEVAALNRLLHPEDPNAEGHGP